MVRVEEAKPEKESASAKALGSEFLVNLKTSREADGAGTG